MFEVYCDSSFNEGETSYIGCTVLQDGKQIHQSTTMVPNAPRSNLDCELEALSLAVTLTEVFSKGDRDIIIYNDSTEAVKAFQKEKLKIEKKLPELNINFEYIPREKVNQSIADSLSKKFPIYIQNILTCEVESFSRREDILTDIARNGRNVLYLEKVEKKSTNKKTCYRLIIRTIDKVLLNDQFYLIKKGGPGTQVKVAEEIRRDLSDPQVISSLEAKGIRLENSYFLLTDETWGLRGTDNQTCSILPGEIPHRIICDEVDRSPENLFKRAERFR